MPHPYPYPVFPATGNAPRPRVPQFSATGNAPCSRVLQFLATEYAPRSRVPQFPAPKIAPRSCVPQFPATGNAPRSCVPRFPATGNAPRSCVPRFPLHENRANHLQLQSGFDPKARGCGGTTLPRVSAPPPSESQRGCVRAVAWGERDSSAQGRPEYRGKGEAVDCFTPTSEPDWRITRIRFSSRDFAGSATTFVASFPAGCRHLLPHAATGAP